MANIVFAEGSNLQNSIYGKSEYPIKMFLEKRAEAFEAESIVKQLFNMETSNHFGEKMTSMTAMDGFQPVGEGGAHPLDGIQEGYSKFVEHMTWKDRFEITREMIDDAKTMDMRKRPEAFITGYNRTREQFGAALLGSAMGGNTSVKFKGVSFDTKSADNKCLFATDHPSKVKGGTQSNKFAGAFTSSVLGAVETRMQNFCGDNGEILDVAPDTIVIANDYGLKNEVFAAIGADKDPATANNAYNYQYGRWNVIVWPYLNQFMPTGDGADKPFILFDSRYNKTYGSAVWFDRMKLEVSNHIDYDTNNAVWDGMARFIAGFNDWRAFAIGGITGATAL